MSIERVRAYFRQLGREQDILEFPVSSATVELAAQAVSRDPELALSMMKYLARTVRLLSEQLDAMAFRPAEWRIARYLLSLSPSGGPVQCTQEDIAAAVSASRVTVSRILNRWVRGGTVALQYRSILLRDPAALEELCRG